MDSMVNELREKAYALRAKYGVYAQSKINDLLNEANRIEDAEADEDEGK